MALRGVLSGSSGRVCRDFHVGIGAGGAALDLGKRKHGNSGAGKNCYVCANDVGVQLGLRGLKSKKRN